MERFEREQALLEPVRHEDVRLPRMRAVTVRREDEVLAVPRKEREAVEGLVEGHPLETRSVVLDHVEIEIASLGVGLVRREKDALPVAEPAGRERRRAQRRERTRARSVGVRDLYLQ